MNGLERITDEIIRTAEEKAAQIKADAKAQADMISQHDTEEITRMDSEFEIAEKKALDYIKSAGESEDRQYRKAALLKTRTDAVNDCINTVKADIINMPDNDYFALMKQLFDKYAESGDGEISFNKRDLDRMPKGFIKGCSDKNRSLTLSDNPCDIDGGFLIQYGRIIVDCSIEALFAEKYNRLADAAKAVFE